MTLDCRKVGRVDHGLSGRNETYRDSASLGPRAGLGNLRPRYYSFAANTGLLLSSSHNSLDRTAA